MGRNRTRLGAALNVVGRQNLDPGIGLPLPEQTLADLPKARGYATELSGDQSWQLFTLATAPPLVEKIAAARIKWEQQNNTPLWGMLAGAKK